MAQLAFSALPPFPVLHLSSSASGTALKMASSQRPVSPSVPLLLPDPTPMQTQIDGVPISYILQPFPPRRTLLLALHGFGASSFSYTFLLPHLSKSPHLSLLSYDAPGFGYTPRPTSLRNYSPTFSAKIATALAAKNTKLPYAILAHSIGALAATRAVLSRDAASPRVAAIILIAPALLPRPELPEMLRCAARLFATAAAWFTIVLSFLLAPLLRLLLRMLIHRRSFWENGLTLARPTPVPKYIVDGYAAPASEPRCEEGLLNFCRAALVDRARALGEKEDFVDMLREMDDDMPAVLVVHGGKDCLVPLANSKRVVERLPGARLVVFDGCGHVPHEEEPEEFSRVVSDFLAKAGVGGFDV